MSWVSLIANWIREHVASQRWLDGVEPAIRQAPDWVLVATLPVFAATLRLLVAVTGPRRLSKQRINQVDKRSAAQVDQGLVAPATEARLAQETAVPRTSTLQPNTIQPTKVYFFGAGASKAEGLLLTSELLRAVREPERFGIDLRKSQIPSLIPMFAQAQPRACALLDVLFGDKVLGTEDLNTTFRILAECESTQSGYRHLTYADVVLARRCLEWLFGIALNPAYQSGSWGSESVYLEFVRHVKRSPGWPVVVTTNWDIMLDTFIETTYYLDMIDCGDCDPPLEEFLRRYVLHDQPVGKTISYYKLNGSLNWLYCPRERAYFGPLFQPPWNLAALNSLPAIEKSIRRKLDPDRPVPKALSSGYCVNCDHELETHLLVPGTSRASLPFEPRMLQNVLTAVRDASELVFVGFSCPPEDRDVVEAIGTALRANPLHNAGQLSPRVIDTGSVHADATRDRFQQALGCSVEFSPMGMSAWVQSLGQVN